MLLRRKGRNRAPLHEHFQFEALRASNIRPVASRKSEFFPLTPGRAARCRRLAFPLFSKVKRSRGASRRPRPPEYFSFSYAHKRGYGNCIAKKNFCANKKRGAPTGGAPLFLLEKLSNHTACRCRENAAFPLTSGRAARCRRSEKSALGEGWGAWGEGLRERLSFGKAEPSRAGRGVSLPPNNLRIVLTGPNGRDIASCRRRAR